jgi:butyryl-CoA dehydrogenase
MAHGTELQKKVFALNEFNGRFSGTMCLSEPQAGSSLSDVATRATPDGADFERDPLGPRYRLKGNKMWISAGEHELSENIVHLVLAKIPGPDGKLVPGTRGISLFIVPKKLVGTDGQLTGERNDVALAGLNHKLGWRGTTNTLLNFGEGKYGSASAWPRPRWAWPATTPRSSTPGTGRRGARWVRRARTPRSRRSASSNTPTSSACCWRRSPTARARWHCCCTARAWSTNSTPAPRKRRTKLACCWKC